MASHITIRPGESIFTDFTIDSGTIPPGLFAEWTIRDKANTVIATDALDKNVDETTFEMRIKSTDTDLSNGAYDLLVRIYDDDAGFADYIYDGVLVVIDA
jgi:hypothetical protein